MILTKTSEGGNIMLVQYLGASYEYAWSVLERLHSSGLAEVVYDFHNSEIVNAGRSQRIEDFEARFIKSYVVSIGSHEMKNNVVRVKTVDRWAGRKMALRSTANMSLNEFIIKYLTE